MIFASAALLCGVEANIWNALSDVPAEKEPAYLSHFTMLETNSISKSSLLSINAYVKRIRVALF